jgi:Spy/CpxP family protein refolding chaperone
MKKAMLILLSVIFINCVFIIVANAEENPLNLIVGAEGQFSLTNSEIIQQKINDLNNKLNLTEEQKQKANDIGIYSAKKLNIYKVQFIEAKNKLINMRKSGAPIQQIQAQVRLIKSLKSRLNVTRDKNMQEFEAILTSEQQAYFDQFKTDLKQIKKTETHFNRENREVQNRDESLKDLDNSN